MTYEPRSLWVWQKIITPHMAGLAIAFARQGHDVRYVAEKEMSTDRVAQGWSSPSVTGVRLEFAPSVNAVKRLVAMADTGSIHICQGIRGNGLVGDAQRELADRRARQWVVMETVDDSGWCGALKRAEYRRLFAVRHRSIEGVLSAGHRTADWVAARGMPRERVYPFSYFLPQPNSLVEMVCQERKRFRVIFVGQFIERKRLDLLIAAIARLPTKKVELAVVGSGALESELRTMADARLPGRVIWTGRLSIEEVPGEMVGADCLVLPSRHDGWGAVVSEALMVGTPVICSDRCGAAGAVRASGVGGVFPSGDMEALTYLLQQVVDTGRQTPQQRAALVEWARCLGAEAGASYLTEILEHMEHGGERPVPPWERRGHLNTWLLSQAGAL